MILKIILSALHSHDESNHLDAVILNSKFIMVDPKNVLSLRSL